MKWPVHHEGATVGKVTSAIYSPRLKRNIGYAWLPGELANEGGTVEVESEWGDRTATVVPMPFVDPGKGIPEVLTDIPDRRRIRFDDQPSE